MKAFHLNIYLVIFVSTIIYLFLLYPVKTQNTTLSEEKKLLNECLSLCNTTEPKYQEIIEIMGNIKYNIFLKMRYKKIKKTHHRINEELTKIKETINLNNYDPYKVIQQLKKLNSDITKFNHKCNQAIHIYYRSQRTYRIIMTLIKTFFIALLVIIIMALIIIGIVSVFVVRRQRKYHPLEEEVTNIEDIEGGKNYTDEIHIIKEKKEEQNSDRKEIVIQNKKDEKKEGYNKTKKSKKRNMIIINKNN